MTPKSVPARVDLYFHSVTSTLNEDLLPGQTTGEGRRRGWVNKRSNRHDSSHRDPFGAGTDAFGLPRRTRAAVGTFAESLRSLLGEAPGVPLPARIAFPQILDELFFQSR